MNVAVFGLGYVGSVTAACLARDGHRVVGVDLNRDKVDLINAGRSPIVETGLDDLIATVVGQQRLRATSDAAEAVQASDVALICVGTPGNGHGQPSLDAVGRVAQDIGAALVGRLGRYTVVMRSTALPGTAEQIIATALAEGAGGDAIDVAVAVNPEFMREGASIHDFDHPPFVLIGTDDVAAAETVDLLYASVKATRVQTTIRTAELVKYVSNAFHALKVCFANEIADLASALGADARDVMRVFALDRKLNISDAYLRPGFAFGGSCLPKDVRALVWAGRTRDVDTPMLSSILPSNRHQIDEAIDAVLAFGRRRIGVVGLAFKAGTDDLRESPVVTLVEALIGKGLDLRILDRNVSLAKLVGANRRYIEREIPHIASVLCDSPDDIVEHAEVVVIGTNSDDARAVLDALGPNQVVVDVTRTREPGFLPAGTTAGA